MSSEKEVGELSPFAEPVESESEWELEIDEETTERVVSLNPLFVPNFNAAEREGVECVWRALMQLGG